MSLVRYIRLPELRAALFAVLLVLPTFLTISADGQTKAREYDVKATLLFNFSQFVAWPQNAIAPRAPFIIGIFGPDPFGKFLDDVVKEERVNGRRIEIRRLRNIQEAAAVQMLFIARSEQPHIDSILAALDNKPVLTVTEDNDQIEATHRCMIAFVSKTTTVGLRINLDRARASGLTISSKLLHVAQIAKND